VVIDKGMLKMGIVEMLKLLHGGPNTPLLDLALVNVHYHIKHMALSQQSLHLSHIQLTLTDGNSILREQECCKIYTIKCYLTLNPLCNPR
jgi:hypothetical protein